MEDKIDFIKHIEKSIVKYWNLPALTDYQGATLQYKDVARKIEKLHILFENAGMQRGDKIALCGRNSAHWATAFVATLTYGAICVPILHEFKPEQVHDITNHSEARLLFVGDAIWNDLEAEKMPALEGIISLVDYSLLVSRTEKLTLARENLNAYFGQKYPKYFRPEHVAYHHSGSEEVALINYTSGTTNNSKGVLIPYRALWSNYDFAVQVLGHAIPEGKARIISMLPMAHMYGMAFEFIFEFLTGAHVFFLTRIPSPKVIFQALSEIKPHIIISVPLIIEKIIKKSVLPKLQNFGMRILMNVPIINTNIRERVRKQLLEAFGGNIYQVIIGGAAFNSEVESFLKEIGFPFTVGYGATECAPIISYIDWKDFRVGSCGVAAPRMEIRIDSKNPHTTVGEVLVKGANVMLGYYKNPDATAETLRNGWYHTGDLGVMDADGYLYLKGRSKNMLLGASGQNIYPEEIEDKLNALPFVAECLVIQKGDKLAALIYPDYEEAEKQGIGQEQLQEIMELNRTELNKQIPAYEQISILKLMDKEFEKTPKRSIKRFLYIDEEI